MPARSSKPSQKSVGWSAARKHFATWDIDERFYNSIESVLDELTTLLRKEPELYPPFAERLAKVDQMTDGIGRGFHDYIADVVGQLKDELGEP